MSDPETKLPHTHFILSANLSVNNCELMTIYVHLTNTSEGIRQQSRQPQYEEIIYDF